MKTTLIKITDDGLSGQAVNLYIKPILYQQGNEMLDEINANSYQENIQEYDHLVKDFAAANPPYPLTEKGEPCKVCEAVLVWQTKQSQGSMSFKTMSRVHTNIKTFEELVAFYKKDPNIKECRQAFEVISNKEEMLEKKKPCIECGDRDYLNCNFCKPVAEQSIEKVAETWSNNHAYIPTTKHIAKNAFIAGANHILNAKGLVSKDRIVDIEKLALVLISDMQLNKPLGYALYINKLMGIIDLLIQIKDIK